MLGADQNVQFSKKHNALFKDFFGKKFKFRNPTSLVVLGRLFPLLVLLRAHTLN